MFDDQAKRLAARMAPVWLKNLEATATGTNGTARARADARAELLRAPLAEIASNPCLDPGELPYIHALMERVAAGRFGPPDSPRLKGAV